MRTKASFPATETRTKMKGRSVRVAPAYSAHQTAEARMDCAHQRRLCFRAQSWFQSLCFRARYSFANAHQMVECGKPSAHQNGEIFGARFVSCVEQFGEH